MNKPLRYPDRGSRSPARPNLAASCIMKRMRESKYYADNALRSSTRKESQGGAAALASASWRTRSLDIEIGDWDILFEAIQTRLRLAVGVCLDVTLQALSPEALAHMRATVLDCSAAMDLLHAALTQERGLGNMPEGTRRLAAQGPPS